MARRRSSGRSRSSSGPSNNTDYSDILDKIQDVGDLDSYVSMVSYGRSGTGKTTFASTWPKPALLLDIKDEGTDSIKDVEGIKVLTIDNWDDIEKAYWLLRSGNHDFKSVHIDTITQLQDKCKEKVTGGARMVTQNQWGEISGLMDTWLMNFRDLTEHGIHVHFIAQDRLTESDSDEDEENQIDPSVGPRLMPSLASKINAAVKVIGNTYISESAEKVDNKIKKTEHYRMRIGPHAYYVTKIRKPKKAKAPKYIEDPTFDKIVKIMKGEWGKPVEDKKPAKSRTTSTGKKPRTRKK